VRTVPGLDRVDVVRVVGHCADEAAAAVAVRVAAVACGGVTVAERAVCELPDLDVINLMTF
jgi:hypothetical protein